MMGARRGSLRRMALSACGTLLALLFLLTLLFSLLQPGPSVAQAQGGDVWFIVTITSFYENGIEAPTYFPIIKANPITVYKDGAAHAEGQRSFDENGIHYDESYVFEGRYDQGSRTLSGDISHSLFASTTGSGDWGLPATLELQFTDSRNLKGTFQEIMLEGLDPAPLLAVTAQSDRDVVEGTTEEDVTEGDYPDEDLSEEDYLDEEYLDEDYSDEDYYVEEDYEEDYTDDYTDESYDYGLESESEDEGSKIPGPGSWWEWLVGTVMAGAVTVGIGLLSTLFGAIPPSDAPPLAPTGPDAPPSPGESIEPGIASAAAGIGLAGTTFGAAPPLTVAGGVETPLSPWASPEPQEPGLAAGTVDPYSNRQMYPVQPASMAPEGIYDRITDPQNWIDAAQRAKEKTFQFGNWASQTGSDIAGFPEKRAKEIWDYWDKVVNSDAPISKVLNDEKEYWKEAFQSLKDDRDFAADKANRLLDQMHVPGITDLPEKRAKEIWDYLGEVGKSDAPISKVLNDEKEYWKEAFQSLKDDRDFAADKANRLLDQMHVPGITDLPEKRAKEIWDYLGEVGKSETPIPKLFKDEKEYWNRWFSGE